MKKENGLLLLIILRLFALYNYGGFYLDSDVRVFKRFDAFLNHGFVSSIDIQQGLEGHLDFGIQAAIMGAEVHNPFVKDCLSYYDNIVTLLKKMDLYL